MTHIQITFDGRLTPADSKTYHRHSFNVPDGMTQLHIDFDYRPHYAEGRIHRNQVDLALDDPDGVRGLWCLVREGGISINPARATPGFKAGAIQPGRWTIYVAAHRILPPDTVEYELAITLSDDAVTETPVTYPNPMPAATTPGWYRGDLHGHSIHSDGSWDIPEFVAYMRGRGLDFVTLSDHNTITGLAQHRSLTEPGFLAMGGLELSTFWGHALALGTNNWYEWRLGIEPGVGINELAQRVIDTGGLFIIAHPMAPDEPFCSGCHWQFTEMRPGKAHGVEVWNGYWHVFNEEGLQQYYVWLNQGYRLVATTGSDIHERPAPSGVPRRAAANVVYASALTEADIIAAVKQGHSYLSAGPELLLTAVTQSGATAIVGDTLPVEPTEIRVQWRDAHEGDVLRLIADGKPLDSQIVGDVGERSWQLRAGQFKWCSVELRDAYGDMWALTNPIFLG